MDHDLVFYAQHELEKAKLMLWIYYHEVSSRDYPDTKEGLLSLKWNHDNYDLLPEIAYDLIRAACDRLKSATSASEEAKA